MRFRIRKQPRQFNVLYVDPPWTFKTWSEKGTDRSASQHYQLLSNADIAALPMAKLAAKDCVLFLWATYPLLPVALKAIEAWGFTYKTVAFTWAKTTKHGKWHMGNGYWTRANAEICLLATRGKPRPVSYGVRQLVVAPVTRHSAKPPEVRDRITELCGEVPRAELFAREQTPGWFVLGNEIDGRDIRDVLQSWDGSGG